jgi:hypothetical protein
MRQYAKALVNTAIAAGAALVAALGTGATDFGDISAKSWLIAAIAVLGSGGMVWFTSNGPAAPAIKAVVGLLTAGFGSAVISLDDDVFTRAEQLTALAAAAAAYGIVYQTSNKAATL